jgi:hypothetical protein
VPYINSAAPRSKLIIHKIEYSTVYRFEPITEAAAKLRALALTHFDTLGYHPA